MAVTRSENMSRSKYYGYWTIDRLEERKIKRPTPALSPIAKTRVYAVYRCPWGCGREFEVPAERATQLRSVLARDHAAVCVPYAGIRPPKPNRSSRVTYASLDSIGPIDTARSGGAGASHAPWVWTTPAPLPPGQKQLPALFLSQAGCAGAKRDRTADGNDTTRTPVVAGVPCHC